MRIEKLFANRLLVARNDMRRIKMNQNIIRITNIIIILLIIVVLTTACGKKNYKTTEDLLNVNYSGKENITSLEQYQTKNPVVAFYIEKYGTVVIELYPEYAPNTVNNFISLVQSGFYDNNTFHRLVKGFVLQGGDPTGTGTGGPDYTIKGEFTKNGVENNLSHKKGIVSMARSAISYDSAGSQFFIVLDNATYLDGEYAAFGKVIDGWNNIEKIISNEKNSDTQTGKLTENLKIKKAIIDLKGKQYPEVEKVQ